MQNRVHAFLEEACAARGAFPAIIDSADQTTSWEDLAAATTDAHKALKEAGVRPGDRVVLVFENSIAVPAFFFAISQLDAIAVVVKGDRLIKIPVSSCPIGAFKIGPSKV